MRGPGFVPYIHGAFTCGQAVLLILFVYPDSGVLNGYIAIVAMLGMRPVERAVFELMWLRWG